MTRPPDAASPAPGYLRVLSRFDAPMLVIGSIIGAGVFFTPNDIGQVTQERGAMLLVWGIGGVIALTGSLSYAELGGLFPRTGGVYVFLREAFGGAAGVIQVGEAGQVLAGHRIPRHRRSGPARRAAEDEEHCPAILRQHSYSRN